MMKTNLTPSPRLIGHGVCCCLKDLLYNKATLILMIFMLSFSGFAQERFSDEYMKAKQAQHDAHLQSIYGNKLNQTVSKNQVQSITDSKQALLEEAAYQELLLEYNIDEQKYLDNGFNKADILALIEEMQTPTTTKGQTSVLAKTGGGLTCVDAVTLLCDTPIFGDNFGFDPNGGPMCGVNLGSSGVWFEINGNGANNTLTLSAGYTLNGQINVYSGSCGSLQCAGGASGNGSPSVTFFAAFEEPYYIFVSGQFDFDQGTFEIVRTSTGVCNDTPPGDGLTPETGFELSCNDVQTIDTTGFPSSSIGGFCGTSSNSTPAVWYKFTAVAGTPETIAIRTCGGDSKLQVFSSPTGGCIDGNDDDSWFGCSTFGESEVNFTANLDETYYVKLFSWSGSGATYDIEVLCSGDAVTPPPQAPDNDVCLDAIQLVCNESLLDQTTVAANVENTQTCGFSIGADVWYSFNGTGEQAIVELTPIGGTAEVEIYQSLGVCGDFTLGNCVANDTFTSSGSTLNLGVSTNSNNVYFVRVAISTPTGNPFDFDITLNCPEPLVNDFCDGAIDAFCGDEITGSTVGATSQSLPSCFTSVSTAPGVWYRHIGTGEILTISTAGSNYDTKLGLYSGDCEALVCIETDDDDGPGLTSEIEITSVAGEEYWIYVTGFGSNVGTYLLSLTCQPDPCQVATDIACGDTATGTTTGGSTAGPSGFCGTSAGATGVFYRYVGTDEFVTASLCNSSYDTKINVYQGDCGALTCVGGNDDSCGSRSEFTWFAGTGEEYYIWVSGFSTQTGNYELTMTCNPPVENDLCENALPLSCDVTISGSTELATTRDNPERDCDGQFSDLNASVGVWYTLVGTGGDIVLSTCNTADYDTKIGVYTGECGNFTCYAGNDDFPGCSGFSSQLTFSSEAGETYYILMSGFGSNSQGNFTLSVDCLCAPTDEGPECVTIYDGYDPASSTTLTGELLYAEEPVTYVWSGSTTPVAGDPSSVTVNAADGNQNISVTMTDAEGCTGTQEFFVYVMDINCDTRGTDKVEVCHNGTTICVAPSAVQAHLNHGDVLGACGNLLCDEVSPECDITLTSPTTNVDAEEATIAWTPPTGLTDGYFVSVTSSGGTVVVDNVDVGLVNSYLIPATLEYDTEYTVNITPYNGNGSSIGCQPFTFVTESDPSQVSCDSPSNTTYCYVDFDSTQFFFTAVDGVSQLQLDVNAGFTENGWDDLVVLDSDGVTELYRQSGNHAGAQVVSTGTSLTVLIDTFPDTIGDCTDNGYTPLDFDVSCYVFVPPTCGTNDVTVAVQTDIWGNETTWQITDSGNAVVASGGPYALFSPQTYTTTVNLAGGTYTFTINDSFGDGIFAPGGYSVTDSDGEVLASNFSFTGSSDSEDFCINSGARPAGTDIKDAGANEIIGWTMSPNPTRGNVNLDLTNYLRSNVSIQVLDFTGKVISVRQLDNLQTSKYNLELSNSLPAGVYFVQVSNAESTSAKKLVIMR